MNNLQNIIYLLLTEKFANLKQVMRVKIRNCNYSFWLSFYMDIKFLISTK